MITPLLCRSVSRVLCGAALAGLLSSCAAMPTPRNTADAQYQAMQQQGHEGEAGRCMHPPLPLALMGMTEVAPGALQMSPELLAPGDRLKLDIAGDKDVLSGTYVVAPDGSLLIGGQVTVAAAGRARADVAAELRRVLVREGLVADVAGNVHLAMVSAASVTVSVEGAVFQPGQVLAGERTDPTKASIVDHPAGGDTNGGRSLSSAVRAAAGVRPDAFLASVYLVRDGHYAVFDERAAFAGGTPPDPQLTAGDRVIVPSAQCFQPDLVRPSSLTPPGIRVYMSNLTHPATSNSTSAIGRDSTSLPYGVRFLQGLVQSNCVGGSMMNGQRHAVLISRNPLNGHSIVIQRSIEQLVRNANRDDLDPYLLPNDAIACYDSTATTIGEVISMLGTAATPAALVKGLTN